MVEPRSPLTPLQVSMLGRRDSLEVARQRTPCGRDNQGQPTLCSATKGMPGLSRRDSLDIARQHTPCFRDGAGHPVRKGPCTNTTPAKENRKAVKDILTPARQRNTLTKQATPPCKSNLAIRSLGLSGSARRVRPCPAHPIADRSSPIAPKSALRAPARRVGSTEAAEHESFEAAAEAAANETAPAEAELEGSMPMFASPELALSSAWDSGAPSVLLLSGARRVARGGAGAGSAAPGEQEQEQEEQAEEQESLLPRGLQSGAMRRAAEECDDAEQLALFAPANPATPAGGSVVRLACAATASHALCPRAPLRTPPYTQPRITTARHLPPCPGPVG